MRYAERQRTHSKRLNRKDETATVGLQCEIWTRDLPVQNKNISLSSGHTFETGTVKHVTWTGCEDVSMVSVGSVTGLIAGFYESGDESS
jgi:hypothetical protein